MPSHFKCGHAKPSLGKKDKGGAREKSALLCTEYQCITVRSSHTHEVQSTLPYFRIPSRRDVTCVIRETED